MPLNRLDKEILQRAKWEKTDNTNSVSNILGTKRSINLSGNNADTNMKSQAKPAAITVKTGNNSAATVAKNVTSPTSPTYKPAAGLVNTKSPRDSFTNIGAINNATSNNSPAHSSNKTSVTEKSTAASIKKIYEPSQDAKSSKTKDKDQKAETFKMDPCTELWAASLRSDMNPEFYGSSRYGKNDSGKMGMRDMERPKTAPPRTMSNVQMQALTDRLIKPTISTKGKYRVMTPDQKDKEEASSVSPKRIAKNVSNNSPKRTPNYAKPKKQVQIKPAIKSETPKPISRKPSVKKTSAISAASAAPTKQAAPKKIAIKKPNPKSSPKKTPTNSNPSSNRSSRTSNPNILLSHESLGAQTPVKKESSSPKQVRIATPQLNVSTSIDSEAEANIRANEEVNQAIESAVAIESVSPRQSLEKGESQEEVPMIHEYDQSQDHEFDQSETIESVNNEPETPKIEVPIEQEEQEDNLIEITSNKSLDQNSELNLSQVTSSQGQIDMEEDMTKSVEEVQIEQPNLIEPELEIAMPESNIQTAVENTVCEQSEDSQSQQQESVSVSASAFEQELSNATETARTTLADDAGLTSSMANIETDNTTQCSEIPSTVSPSLNGNMEGQSTGETVSPQSPEIQVALQPEEKRTPSPERKINTIEDVAKTKERVEQKMAEITLAKEQALEQKRLAEAKAREARSARLASLLAGRVNRTASNPSTVDTTVSSPSMTSEVTGSQSNMTISSSNSNFFSGSSTAAATHANGSPVH